MTDERQPEGLSEPLATYRLQFSGAFTFDDAARVVPYLAALGISHIYASPYLKARAGSRHGYDVVDHNALDPEIGDEARFAAFSGSLRRHGLGQILDFVPNHMGIGRADNAWWLDVLEWGEGSPFAEYFDIDWTPAKRELKGKVLLPFLGDHYGTVLEAGQIKLSFDEGEGSFSVWYYEHRFPVTPGTYTLILTEARKRLPAGADAASDALVELELVIAGFRDLRRQARSPRQRTAQRAKARRLLHQLRELAGSRAEIKPAIAAAVAGFNGDAGRPASFARLHRLLQEQHYRLAFWRVAAEEINYRRFFQINDLAGIRVEVPGVFDTAHRLVLRLVAEGHVHGLRIDHVDGLFDPRAYLVRLQARIGEALSAAESVVPGAAGGVGFYIVIEKILAHHERLRDDWPIAGTTGYDFLNKLNGLFVDAAGESLMTRTYDRFIGGGPTFETITYEGKKQAMDLELASELRVLANEFNRLTETSWLTRDHTLVGLRQALREVVACFPVYRTYIDRRAASAEDRRDIDWAVAHARRRSQRVDKSVFDFVYGVLTTDFARGRRGPYNRAEVRRLAMKFQQYTGPVMAKGVEDTAFYRFNRLVSLNEVGGEPARFGTSVAAFHHHCQDQARRWPLGMLTTATHDTKRGEDVRQRINVLSDIASEWSRRVRRWGVLNRRRKSEVDGRAAPDANDEYLFYQTLVGVWPAEFGNDGDLDEGAVASLRDRLIAYMVKAVREAKAHSMWIDPDQAYEEALAGFIVRVLDVRRANPFLADFRAFHGRVAALGMLNGLAQTILKLTAPGVPDLYQGCELWDLSLVDPDNRRPVDFDLRSSLLERIRSDAGDGGFGPSLLAHWSDGMVKLFVVWRLLGLRRERRETMQRGSYVPLEAAGVRADHLCAFIRSHDEGDILVAVPRLMARLVSGVHPHPVGVETWSDTTVVLDGPARPRAWINVLSGERIEAASCSDGAPRLPAAELFGSFPGAVCVPATLA